MAEASADEGCLTHFCMSPWSTRKQKKLQPVEANEAASDLLTAKEQ